MKKIKYFLLTKSVGLYINVLSYVYPEKATQLAYRLFSNPRLGRLTLGKLPPILEASERTIFNYNGQEFQTYTWHGNATTILLVHGWESNASRWEKLIPYLQKTGSTIVALDAPAHGLSTGKEFNVPVYAEFINVVVQKFQPKHMIGHSIGGAACVYFQYKFQNQELQKMVLLGAPSDLKILIANYKRLLGLNAKMEKLLAAHFLKQFDFHLEDFSSQKFGKKLKLKGIIAHDIDDTVVAFEEGKKVASSWQSAEFITTNGLGHSMHNADLYLKIINFLDC